MLFSNREVAKLIDAKFEPVWVSVRPAPLVTIDFGNGDKVVRTLQGNVATYVCDAAGIVHDVLPGIYTPKPYCEQLTLLANLVNDLAKFTDSERQSHLKNYHRKQAAFLNRPVSAQVAAAARMGGGGMGGFGSNANTQFAGAGGFGGNGGGGRVALGGFGGGKGGFGGGQGGLGNSTVVFGGIEGPLESVLMGRPVVPPTPPGGDIAQRTDLAFDVIVNESIRRKMIHEHLATKAAVRPDDIKQWLFRVVLKADLDDPHLGLDPVLNANYPFADEDRKFSAK